MKRLKLVVGTGTYTTPNSCFSSCLILQSFGRFSCLYISCGYVMEINILTEYMYLDSRSCLQTHFASFIVWSRLTSRPDGLLSQFRKLRYFSSRVLWFYRSHLFRDCRFHRLYTTFYRGLHYGFSRGPLCRASQLSRYKPSFRTMCACSELRYMF